ncbi:MAG: aryl-sulfate sulfotransferase [Chloroflexota bacterium]
MGYSPFRPTGTTHHDRTRAFRGYTLFTSSSGDTTYLIDMEGELVHRWQPPAPLRPYYGYLLPDSHLLLRCSTGSEAWPYGGASSAVVELDWQGHVLWQYQHPALHHDHCRLRNGNTLVLFWEELPGELASRVQGGAPAGEERLLGDGLWELTPAGEIAWEWHASDHLDPVADAICPLEKRHEWSHANAVEELPDGNLLLSFRQLDTIAVVERASGRFLWKWGRGVVSHQHDPNPLPNGNVLLFDNGTHGLDMPRSRAIEVNPRSGEIVWEYHGTPKISFFSPHISGVQRLPNSNTLICEGGPGRLFEVTPDGEIVWEYVNPFAFLHRGEMGTSVFRAHRYAADSPQLGGRL